MGLNIEELELLILGLSKLGGNTKNWGLQDKIIKEIRKVHNEIELEKNDDRICHWDWSDDELTGFKELDNPDMP